MDSPASDPSPRVTIRDLAKRLGLAHATVSMALRDHPQIAAKTKKLVKEEAERCGYRPEPMLSALAAYRQMKRPPQYHGTLAWLFNKSTRKEQFSTPLFKLYFEGACSRASSLGFQVEEFHLDGADMSPARMSNILLARGVQGLLVGPQPEPNTHLEMRWEWFSPVTFGFSLIQPQLHLVGSTQYRIGMATTSKLQELGYQRIGFFGSEVFDQRTDRNFTAGFHIASLDIPSSRRIPPLLTTETDTRKTICEKLRTWVKRWKIDATVCVSGMQFLFPEAGFRIPEDFAVALLGWQGDYPGFAGMDEQGFLTGVAAVDHVVGMIHRGERGVPAVPYRVLIEGKWVDGASAPPATLRPKLARK